MATERVHPVRGLGLDEPDWSGQMIRTGAAANELTAGENRDPVAGTPWHNRVRAHPSVVD